VKWLPLVALFPLAACGSPLGPCSSNIPAGTISADVGGQGWSSTATFRAAGSNLQINAEPSDGWFMNFVLQRTIDGALPGDAVAAGVSPFEVDLGDGGFATLYEDGVGSYSTNDGSGTLRVVAADASSVTACFAYTAGGDGSVDVHRGALNASLAE
jgi:hypothetical protein